MQFCLNVFAHAFKITSSVSINPLFNPFQFNCLHYLILITQAIMCKEDNVNIALVFVLVNANFFTLTLQLKFKNQKKFLQNVTKILLSKF